MAFGPRGAGSFWRPVRHAVRRLPQRFLEASSAHDRQGPCPKGFHLHLLATRRRALVRCALVGAAGAAALLLVLGWRAQTTARLSCVSGFEPREEHNGYLQVNVLGPAPTEETFNGELFLYYPTSQEPGEAVRIVRSPMGTYAASILESRLVPFSLGRATPKPLPLNMPTPGISQRRFPFDSAMIDLRLEIDPPIRPATVIVRNLSPDFIPVCGQFTATWETGALSIKVPFRRNPFVQRTVVVMAIAAVLFALLLGS